MLHSCTANDLLALHKRTYPYRIRGRVSHKQLLPFPQQFCTKSKIREARERLLVNWRHSSADYPCSEGTSMPSGPTDIPVSFRSNVRPSTGPWIMRCYYTTAHKKCHINHVRVLALTQLVCNLAEIKRPHTVWRWWFLPT